MIKRYFGMLLEATKNCTSRRPCSIVYGQKFYYTIVSDGLLHVYQYQPHTVVCLASIPIKDPAKCTALLQTQANILLIAFNSTVYTLDTSEPTNLDNLQTDGYAHLLSPELLVSFVRCRNLWVFAGGAAHQLTFLGDSDGHLSNGTVDAITSQEFNRTQGCCWRPLLEGTTRMLLYTQTSYENVELVKCGDPSAPFYLKYPFVGCGNSKIELMVCCFEFPVAEFKPRQLKLSPALDLYVQFPFLEYIPRIGWSLDGQSVWAWLLDREQKLLVIVMIPLSVLLGHSSNIHVIYKLRLENGINVTDTFIFVPTPDPRQVRFLIADDRDVMRRLYIHSCSIDSKNIVQSTVRVVDNGGVELLNHRLWINSSDQVFFMASENLKAHLYVSSFALEYTAAYKSESHKKDSNVVRLTKNGSSHSIVMSHDCKSFATISSNLLKEYQFDICTINDDLQVEMKTIYESMGISSTPVHYINTELFKFSNRSGIRDLQGALIHGIIYKPCDFKRECKYPVMLYVYGGPGFQSVTNKFPLKPSEALVAVSLGFIVIITDSRGSANRGLQFEREIQGRLGYIELQDQIESLIYIANDQKSYAFDESLKSDDQLRFAWKELRNNLGIIDTDRVVIYGWSYGGFLSLLAIALYPSIFQMCCAGAPVSDWKFYNTAYTERYMNMLKDNPGGYKSSSIVNLVHCFPDQ